MVLFGVVVENNVEVIKALTGIVQGLPKRSSVGRESKVTFRGHNRLCDLGKGQLESLWGLPGVFLVVRRDVYGPDKSAVRQEKLIGVDRHIADV